MLSLSKVVIKNQHTYPYVLVYFLPMSYGCPFSILLLLRMMLVLFGLALTAAWLYVRFHEPRDQYNIICCC